MNYTNNSMVTITDIGSDDRALLCITNNSTCCRNKVGEWYFPNKSIVLIQDSGGDFYRNRGDQVVRLHRRNNACPYASCHGEYCCEVPNAIGNYRNVCDVVTPTEIEAGEQIKPLVFLYDYGNSLIS